MVTQKVATAKERFGVQEDYLPTAGAWGQKRASLVEVVMKRTNKREKRSRAVGAVVLSAARLGEGPDGCAVRMVVESHRDKPKCTPKKRR